MLTCASTQEVRALNVAIVGNGDQTAANVCKSSPPASKRMKKNSDKTLAVGAVQMTIQKVRKIVNLAPFEPKTAM